MSKYPFIRSYEKIPSFFKAVREAEVPDKFTYRHFADIGFPSSRDRDFVETLRVLGFIDEKSRPTHHYSKLKDVKQLPEVIKDRVMEAYNDLWETDKNILNVSENVTNGYFGRLTGESMSRCQVYTRTFQELIDLAEWEEKEETEGDGGEQKEHKMPSNINLNISLPTTTDEKVYETLFKHLKELISP